MVSERIIIKNRKKNSWKCFRWDIIHPRRVVFWCRLIVIFRRTSIFILSHEHSYTCTWFTRILGQNKRENNYLRYCLRSNWRVVRSVRVTYKLLKQGVYDNYYDIYARDKKEMRHTAVWNPDEWKKLVFNGLNIFDETLCASCLNKKNEFKIWFI